MTATTDESAPTLNCRDTEGGALRMELLAGDRVVSQLTIIPMVLRVGAATVRMDGIGGVHTEADCRRQGYARRLLAAAVDRMRQGDAALSMLYGIQGMYHRFGYATAGPAHFLRLTDLASARQLPPGWQARPFAVSDLAAVRDLYRQSTAAAVGAAVREETAGAWRRLQQVVAAGSRDACRVVVAPGGNVAGYVWRVGGHWATGQCEQQWPDAAVFGEVVAPDLIAAAAALSACAEWAAAEGEPVRTALLPLPPDGTVAVAGMSRWCHLIRSYSPAGDSMARVLDVRRLLSALAPELESRLAAARSPFRGVICFRTDVGSACLRVGDAGVAALDSPPGADVESTATTGGSGASVTFELPQQELARLALGAFPPDLGLATLSRPLNAPAEELLRDLFPPRHPHLYLVDRF
jgi:hypothetical protein